MMRVKLTALAAAAVLGVFTLAPIGVSAKVDGPGFIGAPNCNGQTRASIAQGQFPGLPGPGLGNAARQYGVTVKEGQALIEAGCIPA